MEADPARANRNDKNSSVIKTIAHQNFDCLALAAVHFFLCECAMETELFVLSNFRDMKKPVILLVDDDPNDRFIMQSAFHRIGVNDPIYTLADGAEAISYIKGEGEYSDRNRFAIPTLLLLDLDMPRINGFDFLRFIKEHTHLRVIPTIILTSSCDPDDVKTAYLLGANSYLVKASTFDGVCDQLKFVYGYWMRVEVPLIDASGSLQTNHGPCS